MDSYTATELEACELITAVFATFTQEEKFSITFP
jgi:hypothetical protein